VEIKKANMGEKKRLSGKGEQSLEKPLFLYYGKKKKKNETGET